MNRNCNCGGHISSYINFNELAECCDCNKCYVLTNGEWKGIPKTKFRILYRERLIEQQKSNYMDKNNASYMLIKAFIITNGYTWNVEDVIEEYQKYTKGFYVSHTMEHIIKNNELAIKVLLGAMIGKEECNV